MYESVRMSLCVSVCIQQYKYKLWQRRKQQQKKIMSKKREKRDAFSIQLQFQLQEEKAQTSSN